MGVESLRDLLAYRAHGASVLYSDQDRGVRRLSQMTALPVRRAVSGLRGDMVVAVYPSLDEPSFAFPVASPAGDYARRHLFPPLPDSSATAAFHAVAGAWIGSDPRTAAVVTLRGDSMLSSLPGRLTALCRNAGESAVGTTAIAIRTTRALFLVFGADSDRPLWAVRFGHEPVLQREFDIVAGLWALDSELVPAPVLIAPWEGDVWIAVQRGVPGLPWFRHKHLLLSASASDLADRMLQAMQRLHRVVAGQPQWRRCFDLSASLSHQASPCEMAGVRPPAALERLLDRYSDTEHDSLMVEWFCQHGDFSPNNLIISDDRTTLIDFEDFGHTVAPLHDELGLAISLSEVVSRKSGARTLQELIAFCLQPTLDAHPHLRPHRHALAAHHLLWRLADSATRPSRRVLAARIGEQLQSFAANPGGWLA